MEIENPNLQSTDFSDIPSLGDNDGLQKFMDNAALQAQGLAPASTGTEPQPASDNAASDVTPAAPIGVTREDLAAITAKVDAINAQLAQNRASTVPTTPTAPAAPTATGYTEAERNFISAALAKGYDLNQINQVIMQRRAQTPVARSTNPALEQRMAMIEQQLRSQEYKQAEAAFIDKLSGFGNKWGLSEQDLVTFGNAALEKGINIAMPNVDLETVFRAVYPEQYAIRAQRMTPTNSSQIYGGTSVNEGNRATANRMEDAYVDAFLKHSMPNQYGMLNKK